MQRWKFNTAQATRRQTTMSLRLFLFLAALFPLLQPIYNLANELDTVVAARRKTSGLA